MEREIIPIVGDGTCLFRSISFILYGHQNNHREICLQVVQKIANEWETYKHFVVGDESYVISVFYVQQYQTLLSRDGTESERLAVFNAVSGHFKAQKYYKAVNAPATKDVFFKLTEIDNVVIGDAFSISLTIENHSSELRTIKSNLTAISVLYTGNTLGVVKQTNIEVSVNPKEARTVRVTVLPEEYKSKVGKNCNMKITAVALVQETKQVFSAEDDFGIIKNKLQIKVPASMKVGRVYEVHFHFINPFAEQLTNCALTLEGPGLQHARSVKLSNVLPNGQVKHSESLVPKQTGSRVLVATFNSDQLTGIKGSQHICVLP